MKWGLVLEGGGMRCAYTVGVLDALMEGDAWADYVVGVSAGASNGASYVSRQPGRVDWAPMSKISAPSCNIRQACPTAFSGSKYRPPSEKESGVMLRIPIMRVRSLTSKQNPLAEKYIGFLLVNGSEGPWPRRAS